MLQAAELHGQGWSRARPDWAWFAVVFRFHRTIGADRVRNCMLFRTILLTFLAIYSCFAQNPFTQTTFGGSGNNSINAVAVDASGNIYVTGTTFSFDLPLLNASQSVNSGTPVIFSTDS